MSNYESRPPRVGLWSNDRGPMASGNCGGIRFVLWDNRDRKQSSNAPDYHLVLEQAQKREERQPDLDRPSQESRGGGGFDDEQIPFSPEVR